MKRLFAAVLAVLAVQAGIGVFVVWSGLYNVAASVPHLPWTTWILHTTLRNSVETHAMPVSAPALDNPSLVHRGLGHYEGACSPCHGAPDERRNAVALRMQPQPPFLAESVREWSPEELFWIVKHGFKYTGMPAWPAQSRDDEVWAMVAFLMRLPELTADEYVRLSRSATLVDPVPVPETAQMIASAGPVAESLLACARCHGMRGLGGGEGGFPRLAGQKPEYLFESLRSYASGLRPSGVMQAVASAMGEEDMRKLADYYAMMNAPAPPQPAPASPQMMSLGRTIVEEGLPAAKIPACAACHGRDGGADANNALFPSLDGQWADYLDVQLRLFRDGVRDLTPTAKIMAAAVGGLTDEQIRAVSAYYASQRVGPPSTP
jgi:cytochrome c553